MAEDNKYHLKELRGSNYEIVDGEPDIIGWNISDGKGRKIGEVEDLLFDEHSRKVRYLVAELDDDHIDVEDDKKVLIPIGIARLHGKKVGDANTPRTDIELGKEHTIHSTDAASYVDEDSRDYDLHDYDKNLVVLPSVSEEQLRLLPSYDKDNLSHEYESTIRNIFQGGSAAGLATAGSAMDFDSSEFYNNDYYNEDRFYSQDELSDRDELTDNLSTRENSGSIPVVEENMEVGKKEVQTGGVRLTSRIVERPVQESINLKEERVNIERTPVDRPVTNADDAFQETEIELTEHAEVPLVSKEARVVEEISLNKEVEENEETIRDTVRKTEVDIEDLSGEDSTTTRDMLDEDDEENRL